jgi:uncharacterized membrane protein YccC
MVESTLGTVERFVGGSADQIRQSLFDIELSLSNIARFVARLERLGISTELTGDIAMLLEDLAASEDRTQVLDFAPLLERFRAIDSRVNPRTSLTLKRLANSLEHYVRALHDLRVAVAELSVSTSLSEQTFSSPVVLRGGFLPGSSEISALASNSPQGSSFLKRGLRPEVRAAVQITIASAVAIVLGDAIDPKRFYWAPLAALLCFVGANTSAEQIVKGLNRVVGTILGVVVGYGIAVGLAPRGIAAVVLMLASIFVGLYLLRVSYLFMAFGVTVALSLLYAVLAELSVHLLTVRLEETVAGAASAVIVALLVVPLSSRRVFDLALVRLLEDGEAMIKALRNSSETGNLNYAIVDLARRMDLDFQSVLTVGRALRSVSLGSRMESGERYLGRSYALRNYLRTLSEDVRRLELAQIELTPSLQQGLEQLSVSFTRVRSVLQGGSSTPYERSAHLFEAAREESPLSFEAATRAVEGESSTLMIINDLTRIDGALAAIAGLVGIGFLGTTEVSRVDGV